MRFHPWILSIFVASSTLVFHNHAVAEDAEASGPIEEVLVTARRREESAQNVPIPITAMSEDQLEERNIVSVEDISRLAPNLQFNYSSVNRGTMNVFLRGIGQVNWSATMDPKIGVYIDGVYMGRPQGGVFDLLDIERIEVLRGPQGTLFGRNTTAGLVNVITRKPDTDFGGKVKVGFGNFSSNVVSANVNIPLKEDTLAARVNFQARNADGYMNNLATGAKWNDEGETAVRASVAWTPSDRFDARFSADIVRRDELPSLASCEWFGPADGSTAAGLPAVLFLGGVYDTIANGCDMGDAYSAYELDPAVSTTDSESFGLVMNLDLGGGTLTSVSSYRATEHVNSSWGNGSDGGTVNYIDVIAACDTCQDILYDFDYFSQEIRLDGSSLDGRLTWVAGFYYYTEESHSGDGVPILRGYVPPSAEAWPLFYAPGIADIVMGTQMFGSRDQRYDTKNTSTAFFVESVYQVNDKFDLTAGLRRTKDEREFRRTQTLHGGAFDPTYNCPGMVFDAATGLPTSDSCYQEAEFDKITPRVIASYKPRENVTVYGGYSMGYSRGGFNQDIAMRPYKPEVSGNWEFGVKSLLRDGRVQANATSFYTVYEEQQLTVGRVVEGQPTADLINAQEAHLYGIEVEIIAAPTDDLTFGASWGYLDGKYKQFDVQDNLLDPVTGEGIIVDRDLTNVDPIKTPDVTLTLSGSYVWHMDGGHNLAAHLGANYTSRSWNSLENKLASKQDPLWLMDARVTWTAANGRTEVAVWARNLTDEEYFSGALDFTGDPETLPLQFNSTYTMPPRMFGIELSHTFGG